MKKPLAGGVQLLESTDRIAGMRTGKVVRVEGDGRVVVDFPGNSEGPVTARLAGSMKIQTVRHAASVGRDVLLVFENGDPKLPIVIDTLHSLLDEISESSEVALEAERPEEIIVDGKRIVYSAENEIVLRCGKASITLTRAGKVLIRGAYLLTRSSGVNRIKGGSVQIN
jgi:hypothetical protein